MHRFTYKINQKLYIFQWLNSSHAFEYLVGVVFSGHYLMVLLNRRRYAQQQQQTQCVAGLGRCRIV